MLYQNIQTHTHTSLYYMQTIFNTISIISVIGCVEHDDCTHEQACIGNACQNPCHVANPCTESHQCQVDQHHPVCVKGI